MMSHGTLVMLGLAEGIVGGIGDAASLAPGQHAAGSFERFANIVLIGVIDMGIVAIFAGILLCLWRLVRGPTLIDRGVAVDTIALQVVGLVVLLTVRLRTLVDFDVVLIVAILGFVSTVAFAQFIGRRGAAS